MWLKYSSDCWSLSPLRPTNQVACRFITPFLYLPLEAPASPFDIRSAEAPSQIKHALPLHKWLPGHPKNNYCCVVEPSDPPPPCPFLTPAASLFPVNFSEQGRPTLAAWPFGRKLLPWPFMRGCSSGPRSPAQGQLLGASKPGLSIPSPTSPSKVEAADTSLPMSPKPMSSSEPGSSRS
jgi:hypothetical protein